MVSYKVLKYSLLMILIPVVSIASAFVMKPEHCAISTGTTKPCIVNDTDISGILHAMVLIPGFFLMGALPILLFVVLVSCVSIALQR